MLWEMNKIIIFRYLAVLLDKLGFQWGKDLIIFHTEWWNCRRKNEIEGRNSG
jgi:hypothetical protein